MLPYTTIAAKLQLPPAVMSCIGRTVVAVMCFAMPLLLPVAILFKRCNLWPAEQAVVGMAQPVLWCEGCRLECRSVPHAMVVSVCLPASGVWRCGKCAVGVVGVPTVSRNRAAMWIALITVCFPEVECVRQRAV